VANDIRKRFLSGSIEQRLYHRVGLIRDRAGLDGAREALGDAAGVPKLPQRVREEQPLPFGGVQSMRNGSDLVESVGREATDAI
jgi:hypothetical protein